MSLIKRSPLTFKFISETSESIDEETKPGIHAVGVASPIKLHEERDTRGASTAKAAQPQPTDIVKTFTMHINPSQRYYQHKTNIRLSPTHGPWPKVDSAQTRREGQDFVYLALKAVVPDSIARAGLCDWHTGGQLSGEPVSMRAQATSAKLWHIRERQERKRGRDRAKETQARLGGDLTAVSSLDALCGSTNEAQRQGPPADLQNRADGESAEEVGSPTPPPPKVPAWVRRKQFKLNPLADKTHSKIIKKQGAPYQAQGNWWEFKSVLNSQADNINLPEPPTEPVDGER